jgi:hypothetical protein
MSRARCSVNVLALATAASMIVLTACAPANERPLSGAVPGSQAPTPPGLPPTLLPADALRPKPQAAASPSPGVDPQPSASPAEAEPSPSPAVAEASPSVVAAPPIVRTIVPGANGHVPAGGAVTLSAVLVGRSADLASASLATDGTDAGGQIDKRSPRDWTIHAAPKLSSGPHTVRVQVNDASGQRGGFTWQITVGEANPQPAPAASPAPGT